MGEAVSRAILVYKRKIFGVILHDKKQSIKITIARRNL
jgi:hypothetical protein